MDRRALLLIAVVVALAAPGCLCSLVIEPDPALIEGDGGEGDGGNCDDGIECTFDRLTDGVCTNVPDDGICGEGSFCLPTAGCIPLRPCGQDEHCVDGDVCTEDRCDRDQGVCANVPALDCDDGVFCNGDEGCDPVNGCTASPGRDCRDEFDCTQDSCDEAAATCVHVPNDAACDDGRACNGAERCDEGAGCRPGEPACPDDGDCAPERCIEVVAGEARCSSLPDHAACDGGTICVASGGGFACEQVDCGGDGQCDDGDACNGDETCDGGTCQPGTPMDCDDGVFCNGEEICDGDSCLSTLAPTCNDGVACSNDACDQGADDCAHVYDDAACADGSSCNGAETCSAVGCAPAEAICAACPRSTCDEATAACVAGADACNGLDDDCNGEPDDGYDCALGSSRPCTAACSGAAGLEPCGPGCSWSALCIVRETCNGVDDDCDGDVDEGTPAPCPG